MRTPQLAVTALASDNQMAELEVDTDGFELDPTAPTVAGQDGGDLPGTSADIQQHLPSPVRNKALFQCTAGRQQSQRPSIDPLEIGERSLRLGEGERWRVHELGSTPWMVEIGHEKLVGADCVRAD